MDLGHWPWAVSTPKTWPKRVQGPPPCRHLLPTPRSLPVTCTRGALPGRRAVPCPARCLTVMFGAMMVPSGLFSITLRTYTLCGNSGKWSLVSMRSMVTVATEQQFAGFPVSLAMSCGVEKWQRRVGPRARRPAPPSHRPSSPEPNELPGRSQRGRAVSLLSPPCAGSEGRPSAAGPTCTTMTWLIS